MRATAIVLSEEAERSLVREGKCSAVTVEEWCSNEPSSRFVEEDVDGIVLTSGRGFGWREVMESCVEAVEEIW